MADFPIGGVAVVQDLLGRGIPGVEIVVFSFGTSSGAPLAVLLTDERGRFSLQGLGPGSYLLALSKPGYQIHLAQANNRLLSLLQIRLSPDRGSASVGETAGSESMDWVLRLPRTDVFKEARPEVPVQVGWQEGEFDGSGRESSGSITPMVDPGRPPVSGEVRQWYSSTLPGAGGNPEDSGSTGRATTLQVGGDLLGRGDWEVRGLAESLSIETGGASFGGAGRDQGANRLRVAMRYNASAEDSVQVQARLDRESFRSDAEMDGPIPSSLAVRTLGYQANWTRKLGMENCLEVAMGFLHSQARLPWALGTGGDGEEADGELRDWRWNAQVGYHVQLPQDHRLSLAARTRIYNYDEYDDGWILTPIQSELSPLETGRRGWGLSLSGEDSWRLSEPLSLILGLDTHLSEGVDRTVILMPRVGARKEGDRSTLQGWLLLRTDSLGSTDARPGTAGGRGSIESETLGYHAEVVRRFQGNWVVSGHLERNPLGAAAVLSQPWMPDPSATEVMLIPDPAAWSQEAGFSISKSLRGVQGSLESDHGHVEGRMTGGLNEAPVQNLEEREIEYLAFRATANVEKTDTQVRLNYTRLAGMNSSQTPGMGSSASRMDLVILQPISFVSNRGAGSWKILLGYQSFTRDPGTDPETLENALPERIQRISGGVGVNF